VSPPTGGPEPVSPDRLPALLAEWIAGWSHADGDVLRVAVDGPPPAAPDQVADALVDPLRVRGRPAARVSARWFLRPASVRLERGRTDPDAYYDLWLDTAALRREVLDPLALGGSGRYLASLWDPVADRATRADYAEAPGPGAVLLLDGGLLLGRGLPFDLTVHLRLTEPALDRRTAAADRWMLPAFARYDVEVAPAATADAVVLVDDPRHPAVVFNSA
jgi:hypothetical protein